MKDLWQLTGDERREALESQRDLAERIRQRGHTFHWEDGAQTPMLDIDSSEVASVASMFTDQQLHWAGGWERDNAHSFIGGTVKDVRRLAREGDLAIVRKAEAMAKELDRALPATGQMYPRPVASVAGGGLSVPAYLGGSPVCFQRPVYGEDATQPVKIRVALNALGSYSAKQLRRRAMCIVGLAKLISAIRPVDLACYQYSYMQGKPKGGACVIYRLGCRPVDWSMAGALLGSPAMYRGLSWALIAMLEGHGDGDSSSIAFGRGSRAELLGLDPAKDLHFGPWENDVEDPMEWVREHLDKFLNGEPVFDVKRK